ncbi:MAG TPA: tetratricopeptide repeat protein [Pyrinomonadaceae bacterium]|nr:tetratricopeptide repeat protein [Pyrinomonadaceae bacterium]
MNKRRVLVIFLMFVLTVSATALWSAEGDEREGDTPANVVATAGAEVGSGADAQPAPKKKGNRFARFLKAPFKAVGKIFGGDDAGKLARMSEKDAARFESVGVVRVEDRDHRRPETDATPGSARDHLGRGRAHLEAGDLNEAVAALSRAVALDPSLGQAHSLLAVAYDRKGLRERAKDSYARAVEVNDSDAQALNNLGYSLYLSGNYRAAVDRLKRAARLAPADGRVLNNLALAQARLGKYDDAYKSFARAGGEYKGRVNVASLLVRAGREEKAIEHLEAARRLQPAAAGVLQQLADLYDRNGRRDKAEEARAAMREEETRQQTFAVNGGR